MVARIKRQKTTEEDHILTELEYIKNRINQSSRILTDKQKTAFFFVVVPEEDDHPRHRERWPGLSPSLTFPLSGTL